MRDEFYPEISTTNIRPAGREARRFSKHVGVFFQDFFLQRINVEELSHFKNHSSVLLRVERRAGHEREQEALARTGCERELGAGNAGN